MSIYKKLFNEETLDNIQNYKFSAQDHSLVYNNITSPLMNKLVTKFPDWLAPNVITLTGFSLVWLSSFLFHIYSSWSGTETIPGFVLISGGILCYIYHLLDLCDGKQARRTGNSTPLGLLVDHGCDSIVTFLLTIMMTSTLKLADDPINYFYVFTVSVIPFYLCTWEEYHTNCLILPIFNGPNEGNLIVMLLNIFTAIVGQEFWIKEISLGSSFKIKLNSLLIFSCLIMSIYWVFMSVKGVIIHYKNNKNSNKDEKIEVKNESEVNNFDKLTNNQDLKMSSNTETSATNRNNTLLLSFQVISSTFLFFIMELSLLLVFVISHDDLIVYKAPKLIIANYGFMFAKLLLHLMIAHISNSEFEQWRMSIIICSTVLPLIAIFSNIMPEYIVHFNTVFVFYLFQNFFNWLSFAFKISWELCDELKINFFKVKSPIKNENNDNSDKSTSYIGINSLE
jgi:phosphatidylglycerophosphate synthase